MKKILRTLSYTGLKLEETGFDFLVLALAMIALGAIFLIAGIS